MKSISLRKRLVESRPESIGPSSPTDSSQHGVGKRKLSVEEQIEIDRAPVEPLLPFETLGQSIRPHWVYSKMGAHTPALPGSPSTTRQAEVLNPCIIAAPTTHEGLVEGVDALSSVPVAQDARTLYRSRTIDSLSVVVVGDIGSAKSSLLKTVYAMRPLILKNHYATVFDRKDQGGEGEYGDLVRSQGGGAEPIKFILGGGAEATCVNLFDERVSTTEAGQVRLLQGIAETARGQALDSWEVDGLREAYGLMRRAVRGRTPVLSDLVAQLGVVDGVDAWRDHSASALERQEHASLTVAKDLRTLLSELGGMFDGDTSAHVGFDHRLTSVDISQLPREGASIPLVMSIMTELVMGHVRRQQRLRRAGEDPPITNLLIEEAWHLATGPLGKLMQSNVKLARGLGIQCVFAFHKQADIPRDSPAMAIIQEAAIAYLYRCSRLEDAQATAQAFGLDESLVPTLQRLDNGEHLLKVGRSDPVRVRHIRSAFEVGVTNTDDAIISEERR